MKYVRNRRETDLSSTSVGNISSRTRYAFKRQNDGKSIKISDSLEWTHSVFKKMDH